jgi:hypothetical protein
MYKNAHVFTSDFCQAVETADIETIKRYIQSAYLDEAKEMLSYDDYAVFRLFVRMGDEAYTNCLINIRIGSGEVSAVDKEVVLQMIKVMNYNPPREAVAKGNLNLLKMLLRPLALFSEEPLPEIMKDNWLSMLRMAIKFRHKDILLYLLQFETNVKSIQACLTSIYPFVVQQLNELQKVKEGDSQIVFDPKTPEGSQFYFYILRHFLLANKVFLSGAMQFVIQEQEFQDHLFNLISIGLVSRSISHPDEIHAFVSAGRYLAAFDLLPMPMPDEEVCSFNQAEEGSVSTLTRPTSFNFDDSAVELTGVSMFKKLNSEEKEDGADGMRNVAKLTPK